MHTGMPGLILLFVIVCLSAGDGFVAGRSLELATLNVMLERVRRQCIVHRISQIVMIQQIGRCVHMHVRPAPVGPDANYIGM